MMMIIASRSSFDMWVERSLAWKVVELLWDVSLLIIFVCVVHKRSSSVAIYLLHCNTSQAHTACLLPLPAVVFASKKKVKCKIIWNEMNFYTILTLFIPTWVGFECAKIIVVKRLACLGLLLPLVWDVFALNIWVEYQLEWCILQRDTRCINGKCVSKQEKKYINIKRQTKEMTSKFWCWLSCLRISWTRKVKKKLNWLLNNCRARQLLMLNHATSSFVFLRYSSAYVVCIPLINIIIIACNHSLYSCHITYYGNA